jgi:hypothetical protein
VDSFLLLTELSPTPVFDSDIIRYTRTNCDALGQASERNMKRLATAWVTKPYDVTGQYRTNARSMSRGAQENLFVEQVYI